ncbi:MAG: tRNA (cytidine(34)-2'-O)-methyltransferase [Kiritimatiellae bacterium]|nr:tRNA (cytidine(34)-2'-O)-methyltransferase [Kiritimatiellia bacterium]
MPHCDWALLMPDRMNIVLVAPEIPHNTGAIGRVCVCLDARLHLIHPLGFSLSEAHVRRAALDYWEHIDITEHASWENFMEAETPSSMAFLSSRGTKTIYDTALNQASHLVFGNESSGLPHSLYGEYADNLCIIPMPGKHSRTLNLSNAVSVVAYECLRQGTIARSS